MADDFFPIIELDQVTDGQVITASTKAMLLSAANSDTPTIAEHLTFTKVASDVGLDVNMIGSVVQNVSQAPQSSVSTNTTANLAADASITLASRDVSQLAGIFIEVLASHDSAQDGLEIEWSQDDSTFETDAEKYQVYANEPRFIPVPKRGKFVRVKYTNGGTIQTTFRLQIHFMPVNQITSYDVPVKNTLHLDGLEGVLDDFPTIVVSRDIDARTFRRACFCFGLESNGTPTRVRFFVEVKTPAGTFCEIQNGFLGRLQYEDQQFATKNDIAWWFEIPFEIFRIRIVALGTDGAGNEFVITDAYLIMES